jgi:hypothetical protein
MAARSASEYDEREDRVERVREDVRLRGDLGMRRSEGERSTERLRRVVELLVLLLREGEGEALLAEGGGIPSPSFLLTHAGVICCFSSSSAAAAASASASSGITSIALALARRLATLRGREIFGRFWFEEEESWVRSCWTVRLTGGPMGWWRFVGEDDEEEDGGLMTSGWMGSPSARMRWSQSGTSADAGAEDETSEPPSTEEETVELAGEAERTEGSMERADLDLRGEGDGEWEDRTTS